MTTLKRSPKFSQLEQMGAMGPFDEGYEPKLSQDYLELCGHCVSWSLRGCPGGTRWSTRGLRQGPGLRGVQSVFWPWFLDGFLDTVGGGPQLRKTRLVTLVSAKHSAIPSRTTKAHDITIPLLCIAIIIAHFSAFGN